MITDLRSDTFTKPTSGMLAVMMDAEVGDDVFGEDPTVNALENYTASLFGMESALFCPSGTMTNQIAIKCHTQPGDEVICDKTSHVYIYEGGGIAFNSGCQVKTIEGNRGMLSAKDVYSAINPDDVHRSRTSLVSLENTANRGGGSCYNFIDIQEIKSVCLNNNLKLHLDGARLWNAMVNCNESASQYGEVFDSISVCLSKGLGAPVGSLLIGKSDFIKQARRVRKVFGGGMRQAGYLAAAGLYALNHHIERLQQDHLHAKMVAEALMKKEFIGKMLPVETNIIIFEVIGDYTPMSFTERLRDDDILCVAISPSQVRMVFHLDVTENMVEKLVEIIENMR
ncbi:MAG: GntG family PLP-dependent aldolase [Ferruginibacter sp.]